MARIHVNPKTGETGTCRATNGGCPFGGDAEHYSSVEEARAAYETKMANATVPSAKKPVSREPKRSTVVPEAVMEVTEVTARAANLRKGNLVEVKGNFIEVLAVKTGYKYATITIPDAKKGQRDLNLPLNDEVKVQVRTETEESKKVTSKYKKELSLEVGLSEFRPARTRVTQDIMKAIESGEPVGPNNIGRLTEAEVKDEIMERYRNLVDEVKTNAESELPYSEAVKALKEKFKNELVYSASRNGTLYSNPGYDLYERARQTAMADFVRHGPDFW